MSSRSRARPSVQRAPNDPQNVSLRDEDAPAKIQDPDAVKPEGWLDHEEDFTSDPNAEKPEDWWVESSPPWSQAQREGDESGCVQG